MNLRLTLLALAAAVSFGVHAEPEIYTIDNTHSFANWELRHIVARTSGTFHDIKGKIVIDAANMAKSSVDATISVYSLNSSHLRRDIHVLTDDFLNASKFPEMKFISRAVIPTAADKGLMAGDLTLHGVTRPVNLEYQVLGAGQDPWGGMRLGVKASTRIKRSEFGITKYANGGPVGDDVDITLLIEGIKQGADGQPWNAKSVVKPVAAVPVAVPVAPTVTPPAPVVAVPAATAPVTPAAPEKKESAKDALKKELLKGLFGM